MKTMRDIAVASVFTKANHELRSSMTLIRSTLQLIETRHPEVKNYEFWSQVMEDISGLDGILNDVSEYIHAVYPYDALTAGNILEMDSLDKMASASDSPGDAETEEYLNREYCDLLELTQSVCDSFTAESVRRSIPISVSVKPDTVNAIRSFYCDRARIKHVFINLIKNALEASYSDCEIQIRFSLHRESRQSNEPMLSAEIYNTGSVIARDVLPHIFQPFYTTKEKGNGLGLSIVKQLILLHGGSITASSGKNSTTFRILLPFD